MEVAVSVAAWGFKTLFLLPHRDQPMNSELSGPDPTILGEGIPGLYVEGFQPIAGQLKPETLHLQF